MVGSWVLVLGLLCTDHRQLGLERAHLLQLGIGEQVKEQSQDQGVRQRVSNMVQEVSRGIR